MAFSAEDIVLDSPTNNFATLNPLDIAKRNATLSDGNLKTVDTTNNWSTRYLNLVPTNGIYYVEFYIEEVGTTSGMGIYVGNNRTWPEIFNGISGYPYDANTFGVNSNGSIYHNGSTVSYSSTYTTGDIVSFIIDYGSRNFWVRVNNNVLTGDDHTGNQSGGVAGAVSLSSGLPLGDMFVYTWQRGANNNTAKSQIYLNTGQDPTFGGNKSPTTTYTDANGIGAFYYQPPAGTKALCTSNLPEMTPDVADDVPQDYFKSVTWTGQTNAGVYNNGNVTVGFQPDLVWIKGRTVTYNHLVFDSVRGVQQAVHTNLTNDTSIYTDALSSFDTDGFTYGTDGTGNQSGASYVAWCWKAGGPPDLTSSPTKPFAKNGVQYETLSAANITAGTITPTAMSVNTDAGFSIGTYIGSGSVATVGHGLSDVDMLIVKGRNVTDSWAVWHTSAGTNGQWMKLNTNDGLLTQSTIFNSTDPSGSTFTLGTNNQVNGSGNSYVFYAFSNVADYSKCGSYTGNGSPDGPFVYCGFRPAFVMVKRTDSSQNWVISDNKRTASYNPADGVLLADGSTAEQNLVWHDFLSNGFKARQSYDGLNASGGTYIFMAFAEQPFKFSNAR